MWYLCVEVFDFTASKHLPYKVWHAWLTSRSEEFWFKPSRNSGIDGNKIQLQHPCCEVQVYDVFFKRVARSRDNFRSACPITIIYYKRYVYITVTCDQASFSLKMKESDFRSKKPQSASRMRAVPLSFRWLGPFPLARASRSISAISRSLSERKRSILLTSPHRTSHFQSEV